MMSEEGAAEIYGQGWAFYLSDGKADKYLPPQSKEELICWIKGYAAALADHDLEPWREHPTIQAALLHHGIDGDDLEDCLQAAEAALGGDEWCRWPAVPVRGVGTGIKHGPFFYILPESANDEMG